MSGVTPLGPSSFRENSPDPRESFLRTVLSGFLDFKEVEEIISGSSSFQEVLDKLPDDKRKFEIIESMYDHKNVLTPQQAKDLDTALGQKARDYFNEIRTSDAFSFDRKFYAKKLYDILLFLDNPTEESTKLIPEFREFNSLGVASKHREEVDETIVDIAKSPPSPITPPLERESSPGREVITPPQSPLTRIRTKMGASLGKIPMVAVLMNPKLAHLPRGSRVIHSFQGSPGAALYTIPLNQVMESSLMKTFIKDNNRTTVKIQKQDEIQVFKRAPEDLEEAINDLTQYNPTIKGFLTQGFIFFADSYFKAVAPPTENPVCLAEIKSLVGEDGSTVIPSLIEERTDKIITTRSILAIQKKEDKEAEIGYCIDRFHFMELVLVTDKKNGQETLYLLDYNTIDKPKDVQVQMNLALSSPKLLEEIQFLRSINWRGLNEIIGQAV